MDKDTVIKVEGLSKKFCRSLKRSLFYGSLDIGRDMLGITCDRSRLRPAEFFALENVSFELRKGEALGIIGSNGSGKTTLLRLINGIFPPDRGKISVRGRIGALIAVGAGFHPHMTGRENIYLNGTIIGMSRAEIDEKFDEIVSFADIGEFIDAPVSTYSSGMTVRLGFSIAIHSNTDTLLADEVLAVGDLSFALKCVRKIAQFKERGGSLILVSHGMQLIRSACTKVIWFDHGKIRQQGDVQSVCDDYEKVMFNKDAATLDGQGTRVNCDLATQITGVDFLDGGESVCKEFRVGEFQKVRVHYDCKRKIDEPIFSVGFLNAENTIVIANHSHCDLVKKMPAIVGKGYVDFIIEKLYLKPGPYSCTVVMLEKDLSNSLDWHDKGYNFTVVSGGGIAYGICQLPTVWLLNGERLN